MMTTKHIDDKEHIDVDRKLMATEKKLVLTNTIKPKNTWINDHG